MKYFYALSDSFTGNNPAEHTAGFANSKKVICFSSKKGRQSWLDNTRLLTAKAISRPEALKLIPWEWSCLMKVEKIKQCEIYQSDRMLECFRQEHNLLTWDIV